MPKKEMENVNGLHIPELQKFDSIKQLDKPQSLPAFCGVDIVSCWEVSNSSHAFQVREATIFDFCWQNVLPLLWPLRLVDCDLALAFLPCRFLHPTHVGYPFDTQGNSPRMR